MVPISDIVSPGTSISASARLATAVYDHIVDPVAEDQQRPFGRKHINLDSGHRSYAVAPYASGIDDQIGIFHDSGPTGLAVGQTHSGHAALRHHKTRDLMISEHIGAMTPCVDHIGHSKPERINSAVRHPHRSYYNLVDRRFAGYGLSGIYNLGRDTCPAAALDKQRLIPQIILGQRYEQTAGLLHAMPGDTPQHHILLDALRSRFLIGHRISGPAMQQAMIAAGRAGRKIETFDKQSPQAAHGAVTGSARTGSTASDHYHIVVTRTIAAISKDHDINSYKLYIRFIVSALQCLADTNAKSFY